jgi:hypothetical protein
MSEEKNEENQKADKPSLREKIVRLMSDEHEPLTPEETRSQIDRLRAEPWKEAEKDPKDNKLANIFKNR